jgi:hypothetical protein
MTCVANPISNTSADTSVWIPTISKEGGNLQK